MSMGYVKANRLVRELTEITVNPESHNQQIWLEADQNPAEVPETACGTTGCLAGNAVLHAGDELIWEPKTYYDYDSEKYVLSGKFEAKLCKVSGEVKSIASRAQELFGLTAYEREDLFAPGNSIQYLWERAIEISDGLIDMGDAIAAFNKRAKKAEDKIRAVESKLDEVKALLG